MDSPKGNTVKALKFQTYRPVVVSGPQVRRLSGQPSCGRTHDQLDDEWKPGQNTQSKLNTDLATCGV